MKVKAARYGNGVPTAQYPEDITGAHSAICSANCYGVLRQLSVVWKQIVLWCRKLYPQTTPRHGNKSHSMAFFVCTPVQDTGAVP
jgi:hypothetical protein